MGTTGYTKELADPWGVLLATSAAAVAWAIHLPAALTAAVGAAVWLGRAAVIRFALRPGPAAEPEPVLEVDPGTDEARWLERAFDAEEDFDAATLPDGPLAVLASEVDETVTTLHWLAGLATAEGRAWAGGRVEAAAARDTLLVRLESAVLSLEDLVAGIAELSAAPEAIPADAAAGFAARLSEIQHAAVEAEAAVRAAAG